MKMKIVLSLFAVFALTNIPLLGGGICHVPALDGKCVVSDPTCFPLEFEVCGGAATSIECGANNVPSYHSIEYNEKCKFNNDPASSCQTQQKSPCAMKVTVKCITRVDYVCEIDVGPGSAKQNVYKCTPEIQMDTEEPYGVYTDAS